MNKNLLTDIEVYEVSLVDKGAIGEVFTLIKAEDMNLYDIEKKIVEQDGKWVVYSEDGSKKLGGPYKTKEEALLRLKEIEQHKNLNKSSTIANMLEQLSDEEFTAMVDSMISKYNEINKQGGVLKMEEIKVMLEEFMTTVNNNFSQVNKSIEELQAITKSLEESKTSLNSELEDLKKNQKDVIDNTNEAIKKSLDSLVSKLDEISKNTAEVQNVVEKIDIVNQVVDELKVKVSNIEKLENASNSLVDDTVQKADKTIFWKSILSK